MCLVGWHYWSVIDCPVSGRVALLVSECNWHPFSAVQFFYTNIISSSSLMTFITSVVLLCYLYEYCIVFKLGLQIYTFLVLNKTVFFMLYWTSKHFWWTSKL